MWICLVIRSMFQSAPPQGGRPHISRGPRRLDSSFNPRPRRGGDLTQTATSARPAQVSIRAPAGGATISRLDDRSMNNLFQSAPPQGGRRTTTGAAGARRKSFNPRPRRGGDQLYAIDCRAALVSIRAPAGGATANPRSFARTSLVSIRAPAGGATCLSQCGCWRAKFQSAPPQGGRLLRVTGL